MRGETLAYPFSTYSVGEKRPSARVCLPDRNYTIPVLAVIASISAVVITFTPGQVEEKPFAPIGEPRASDQHKRPSGEVSEGARPGFDWRLGNLQLPSTNLSRQVPASAAKQRSPARPRMTVGMQRNARALVEPSSSRRDNHPEGITNSPSLIGQADNTAAALVDCSPVCPADGSAIMDAGSSSSGIHETIADSAFPLRAAEVLEDSSVSQLIAPERQPLLADYDHGKIVQPSVGSSALRAAEAGPDPAVEKVIDGIDEKPLDLADTPKSAQPLAELSSGARAATSLSRAAIGIATPANGESPTVLSTHLARIKERYDDTPGKAFGAQNAKGPETTPDAFVDASLSGAPLTQKLGSTIIVQDNELVAIKLSELISLFESRLERPLFVWMSTASAASKFVTTDTLASAGIRAHYDSGSRRLVLSLSSE